MPATRTGIESRLLPSLLFAVFALLLLLIATGGPDCRGYLGWSRAAQRGEIGEIADETLSPTGLPLTQWSHGPGLFFALPYISPARHLVPDGPLAPLRDFRLMGWLAALALWSALLGLLRRITKDHSALTWFVVAAAFAGTHLGFYSFVHSSEILSIGCLALIAWWFRVRDPLGRLEVLGIGLLAACLVLTRPHLAIYLPLIIGVLGWRLGRQHPAPSRPRQALYCLAFAVPVALAVAQVLWVNRWMTGSLWRSPHTFGDASFRSLDFLHPELLAALFHPLHGLLVYHPLYALAFALVVVRVFRGSRTQRTLHAGIALTLLAHLYVQAAWYCWWLGMWSLGNRGLAVGAILLVPVIASSMREARPRNRYLLGAGVIACSLWSLVLMIQGHTNFVRWSELLAAQAATVRRFLLVLPLALGAALAAWYLTRHRNPNARRLAAGTSLMLAPSLDYIGWTLGQSVAATTDDKWVFVLRICLVALSPMVAAFELPPAEAATERMRRRRRTVLAAVGLLLFVSTGALFLRLARNAEARIAAGGMPGGAPVTTFQVTEVEKCYREYLAIPGFEDKKASLKRFLVGSELRRGMGSELQ